MKKIKTLLAAAFCALSLNAGATVVSFDIASSGYTQDSAVAADLFSSSGLMLSNGVVTACGGECISNPLGEYNGSITGNFMGSAYTALEFVGVLGNASIDLFDQGHNLVTSLTSNGQVFMPDFEGGNNVYGYAYAGTTGIASWTANLKIDGLIQMSFDHPVNDVPEPSSALLALAGMLALASMRSRAK